MRKGPGSASRLSRTRGPAPPSSPPMAGVTQQGAVAGTRAGTPARDVQAAVRGHSPDRAPRVRGRQFVEPVGGHGASVHSGGGRLGCCISGGGSPEARA